jgi:hypothetical protein
MQEGPFERPALHLFSKTVARDHGQARIFREARIGEGEFAEIKDGAKGGFDTPRMKASVAQTCIGLELPGSGSIRHAHRIAQGA